MATEFLQYSKAPFKRLSLAIVPINYELRLKPNLENFTFVGDEKIQLKVQETADEITLNSAQIEIFEDDTLQLVGNGHKKIPLEKLEYNAASQTVTFRLKEPLEKDHPATLSFRFSGIINEKLSGFYRSKYMGPDGKVRWTAVTQFAPTDARRAFPCWDEPAIKATFDISLIVPKDDKIKALSNMAVSRESLTDDGFRMVKFTRTPVMSTYLVAFAIGEFDYCETRSGDGVLVRVYTPIGKSDQGKFAMDVCAKSLDFYKHYFQIAYPLNKMDLIAVSDFALGAMENWGLVTYREIRLLVDPANTSTLSRQNVALVVAHELAHQWFGNLVTMEWWTDLWLNEGFASFIEFLCVDHIFPEYNIWTQFVVDVYLRAMDLDGLQSSHPIEVPIGHPSEIDEIFDAISYSKGASIIRMLHKYIGDDAFRKGMNLYLTKHSYGNAQTDDLWLALEESSKKPIRKVMSSWTKQKGYPLVSISAFVDPASSSRFLTLSQEKFNLNGKMADEERQALWTVPVSIITSSTVKNKKSPVECLFEGRTLSLPLDKKELGPDDWFKLNPMTVGTYRVRYMPEQLEKFYGAISSGALPPLDRLGLLTDLLALVLSGKQTTVSLLRFMQSFRSERDYIVWSTLNDILARFDQLFANTDFHPKYCQFGRSLLNESIFPAVGWTPKPDEPYLDSLLRSAIITRLVGFEDESVLKECRRLFDEHVAGKSQIPADLRAAVYRGVAINADQETFDTFLRLMRQSDLQEEKNRISFALGWMKDEQLISRVLQLSLSEDIRSQDTIFVINTVASNPAGRDLAWKFFQQNKREFAQRYVGSILLSRFVKMITVNFCTEQDAAEIEQFFTDNCFPGVERSVQQATETIRLNAEVMARDSESVRSYLKSL